MYRTKLEISRDLVARKRAIDHLEQTGYPHVDKTYLKYYSLDNVVFADLPDTSMYGLLLNTAFKNRQTIAIHYFGRKITYEEFINNIDKYANTFKKMGVEKGEIVTLISPNLPETFYSLYALNKIGAIVNLIDPRNDLDIINYHLTQTESKRLIMIDNLYSKLKNIVTEKGISEVYTISAADSLPIGLNYIERAKLLIENHRNKKPNCPENKIYKSLRKMVLKNSKNYAEINPFTKVIEQEHKGEDVAVIVSPFEITGNPKGIVLTNENLNVVAYDYKYSGMDYNVGERFLNVMPCTEVYGVGIGTHMPFVLGLKNIVIPAIKPNEFGNLVVKYRPNHFVGLPIHYQYMMENPIIKRKDLSFIKTPTSVGDIFDAELKDKTNKFLANHNCSNKIKATYGSNENSGIAYQFYIGESNPKNELETVGIPAFYTSVKVEDSESHESLKNNEIGEIVLTGRGMMNGYFKNQELTNEVIEEREYGRVLHTGDLGHIDENGCIYIDGQLKRSIVAPDGCKIFLNYIEDIVLKHYLIDECACVGLKDSQHEGSKVLAVFIKIKEGFEDKIEEIISEIETLLLAKLLEKDIVIDYFVLERIPKTEKGIIDYDYLDNNYNYSNHNRTRKKEKKTNDKKQF